MSNIECFSDGFLFNELNYENDNNFIKVKYKNKLLIIETPYMRIPFGNY